MLEQTYYSVLRNLGVKLDYRSDNLFRVCESEVEGYIGRVNYLELKKIFDARLRSKYLKEVGDLGLLSPVRILGVSDECYYLESCDLLGVVRVHYILSLDKLHTVTESHEGLIEGRVPDVGELDMLYKTILENSVLYGDSNIVAGDFVFDKKDWGREELLRVISVQSVYKNYCYYIAMLETSEGLIKTLPLQSLERFKD
jgi:hypothetical protein